MGFCGVEFIRVALTFALLVEGMCSNLLESTLNCDFPAIYNFGDSNSDTGGISAAFYPMITPSGDTYFHRPAGRASDGRLVIDFLADHLGLPLLSAYLDSVGTKFRHGANFATGGATIRRPNSSWFQTGVSPFPLDIQVEQFTQFKERSTYFFSIYNQDDQDMEKERIPRPEDFAKAIYTFDIGQNDISGIIASKNMDSEEVRSTIAILIDQFAAQIRDLYGKGARVYWIHNTGPIGCLPLSTVRLQNPPPESLDEYGCIKTQNSLAMEFNKQLKDAVVKLRSELSEAALTYVDMYSAKYELISNAEKQGFEKAMSICCGIHGIGKDIWCGQKGNVNGSEVSAGSCKRPSAVISWDGVHYSEAANSWLAARIANGSFSDTPNFPISRACHRL